MKKISNPMRFAINLAKDNQCEKDIPVACVIVNEHNFLISKAINMSEKKHDPTAHAEIEAIKKASKILRKDEFRNLSLYVTLEPCPMCEAAIIISGIKKIYFGAYDISFKRKLLEKKKNYHNYKSKLQFFGGICEEECKTLMDNFFKKIRRD